MKIKNILSLVILINFAIVSQIFTMQEPTKKQMVEEDTRENIEKQKRYEFFKSHPEIFNIAKIMYWSDRNVEPKLPMEISEMIAKYIVDIEAIKNENGQALLAAIKNHNLDEAKELLKKHSININVQNDEGLTALHLAASKKYNNPEIVQMLLLKGANPDLQNNKYGTTALHYAARNNKIEIVNILLDKGANTDLQNKYGETALFYALTFNYKEIVQILLQKGANWPTQFEQSALHYAVRNNHIEIVQILQAHFYTRAKKEALY